MAAQTQQAYDAGASTVHVHFRNQGPGWGTCPTWDLETVGNILGAIKARVPEIIICMSTGVVGPDISARRPAWRNSSRRWRPATPGSLQLSEAQKRWQLGLAPDSVRQSGGQGGTVSEGHAR